ncbi:hypothetical protein PRZ48_009084 [Zasmidium cellare]|uniref:Glycoside hydrolase family 28 protein n=1 Tax=Zasmidium cellare TaxID=395010 RepID=A0ABR0EHD2_ZASCE|nr:hypothetical protein PRZ48_009084 [Zasmidium cellare]
MDEYTHPASLADDLAGRKRGKGSAWLPSITPRLLSNTVQQIMSRRFVTDKGKPTAFSKMADARLLAHGAPEGIPTHPDYTIAVRPKDSTNQQWVEVAPLRVAASSIEPSSGTFTPHNICVASFDTDVEVDIVVHFRKGDINEAAILPSRYGIDVQLANFYSMNFSLDQPRDVMLILNDNKWNAVHLLVNRIDHDVPQNDTEDTWYFGPGINNGRAYEKADGGKLAVPSGKTVYLAAGAFLTAGLHFDGVENAAIRGHGFIYDAKAPSFLMEKQGAVLIERSSNISITGITSLSATGFGFLAGNGDGLHFLAASDVSISNCFLRNSDDTIAINCDRWDYHGDSENYIIRDCVLLPDIAHPILIGTHGDFSNPSTIQNIHISNIDILDHEESQLWYQGCIAINAGDGNLIQNITLDDIRVRKITKGQLINIRVMQNAMWTKGPGRGVRDVTFRNLHLERTDTGTINPSQILGYGQERKVEGVRFENLRIDEKVIHGGMGKPRWYMAEDFVPVFVNEHVEGLTFEA